MRRWLLLLLVLGMLLPATSAVAKRSDECRYQSYQKAKWTPTEVKMTIRCVASKFNVSVSMSLFIADRESEFRHRAVNTDSGACGVYQHIPRYYPDRVYNLSHHRRYGPYRKGGIHCFNARQNIFAALNMVHHGGWGPWGF